MREHNYQCSECGQKASGVWRIITATNPPDAAFLCARCGLYDYVHKRITFTPSIRTELVKSFTTDFVPVEPPAVRVVAGNTPITELVRLNGLKRHGKSSVAAAILENYRHV